MRPFSRSNFRTCTSSSSPGRNHVDGIGHAAPGKIGDVQQAVDPADIHEYAIAGNALDRSVEDLALGNRIQQFLPLRFLLFLENRAPADHHVSALAVQLENSDLDIAILPFLQFMHWPKISLRSRQERAHTHVNDQAALHAIDDPACQCGLVVVRLIEIGPNAASTRALIGDYDVAILVLAGQLNFDVLSRIQLNGLVRFHEFARRNQSFGLAANVDDHTDIGNRYNSSFDDFPFGGSLLGRGVLLHQLIQFFARGCRCRFVSCSRRFRNGSFGTGCTGNLLRRALRITGGGGPIVWRRNIGLLAGTLRTNHRALISRGAFFRFRSARRSE